MLVEMVVGRNRARHHHVFLMHSRGLSFGWLTVGSCLLTHSHTIWAASEHIKHTLPPLFSSCIILFYDVPVLPLQSSLVPTAPYTTFKHILPALYLAREHTSPTIHSLTQANSSLRHTSVYKKLAGSCCTIHDFKNTTPPYGHIQHTLAPLHSNSHIFLFTTSQHLLLQSSLAPAAPPMT